MCQLLREKKTLGPLPFPASGDMMTVPCLMMESESQCGGKITDSQSIGIDPCRCTKRVSEIHRVPVKVERTPDSAYNAKT